MKMPTMVLVGILAIFVAVALVLWILTPAPVMSLLKHRAFYTEYAEDSISGKNPVNPAWKSRQHIVSEELSSMGIDSVAVEGVWAVFHVHGTALMSYDEYLVYIGRDLEGFDVRRIKYLEPPDGSRVSSVKRYGRWVYVKVSE